MSSTTEKGLALRSAQDLTEPWPHLFRDCLLTSVAVDHPDLVKISATLLGTAASRPGRSTTTRRTCWMPAAGMG